MEQALEEKSVQDSMQDSEQEAPRIIQQVFKRVEKKYLVNTEQFNRLIPLLEQYMHYDEYGLTTICNIYFDNSSYELIRTSIERPSYKEKFRIRSYGVPTEDDTVFLEIKKKYKGVVYKRRIPFKLKEAREILDTLYASKRLTGNIIPEGGEPYSKYGILNDYTNNQMMHEIEYIINHYKLHASWFVAYDRFAMFGNDDPEFRVTFDKNIRTRTDELTLDAGDRGAKIIKDGCYLMEIKTTGAMPMWLVKELSDMKLYPYSFSKYGNAYKRKVMEEHAE